jgi:hypothetical protein
MGIDVGKNGYAQEGELAALVRRWMASGGSGSGPDRVEEVAPAAPRPRPSDPPEADAPEEQVTVTPSPRLPRREVGEQVERVGRSAVLIEARRTSSEASGALLATLAGRGAVSVCRAYGDWSRPDLGEWAGRMRRHGLHSFHHFADEDDQVLVAMAIDAVDIARDAAVDEVVVVGDHASTLPLVHRLHAAGVRVVAVGPDHTPHEVRAACDEFIGMDSLAGERPLPGRHRA